MSIRRTLALAGAAALASSMVLAGAQGAMAVGAGAAPSATASAEKSAAELLGLSLQGVPDTFIAGGDAREFSYRIDNTSKHDDVLYPFLKFKNKAGSLKAKDFKVEYQLPGEGWQTGAVAPGGGDGDDSAALILLGRVDGDGNPSDDALLVVNRGKNLTIKVRVSFTGDAPLGKAGVVPVVFAAALDDDSHLPGDNGGFSCEGIRGAGFTIKKAGPTPTGKPTPTTTTSPTATHTPTHTPTPTGSPTTSHTPTATATPSTTATATPTGTPSTQPTTPAPSTTATGSPSASPSASGTTAAPAPSGGGSTEAPEPIDFPVSVPKVTPPKIVPAAVTKAKAAADNADKALATTGGGDDTTAIAAAGGAVLVAGIGTLVVLRRRKSAQQG
ncbi:LPXTG cell wall anchor domain-containing protein [Streptomyces sp. SP17BM10]|uniref:LPXTG cell wall anchor domain-containing protein n=1 Tax=Streptomyces sp. SP17BM10 TaxID=3002530 RepID=UPI002E777AE0|nr:LPXTG cell wall anchor domain-containing protein [Streptomyces sp. SP17BM10]MEE1783912.1 LPXTG cell wall anchor domain-containing protein [Streptomyces sp. SP17BM10]